VNPNQPGNAGETEQRLPGKALMPILAFQRHWLKSVIVFIVIAGLGLPVAWKKGTATYYAEAVIQVNFRYAANLRTVQEIETHSDTQYRRLVQQQIRTITRFDVVKRALDSLGDQRWVWQGPDESERNAIQRLMGALQITAIHNTYLVTIGLWDEDPNIIPMLINPIVKSYLKASREELFVGEDLRLQNLETRRIEIEVAIEQLAAQLEQKAQELGLTTFEEGLQNPYDRILVDMSSALSSARQKRLVAEAELSSMLGKHERLLKLSLDAEAQKMTASDRALGDLRAYLYQRRAQLVQTMSGLKPTHEGRQAAEREIEQINTEIVQATEDKEAEMKAILEERRRAEMRSEIAEYEANLEEARRIEEALQQRVDERSLQIENFMRIYNESLGIKEELDRQRRQLNIVLDRIDEIKIEENAPGYVRLVSLAEVPELPASGGRKKLFILFLVAATGAALIIPLALEFLDSRIRTPIDLHRIIGFAPNGWLPEITSEEARALFDQQMSRIAISLFRDISQFDQHHAFFVTAILEGAGKTFVTYQLGDHLQRLGIETVVLSCDPSNLSAAFEAAARTVELAAKGQEPKLETEETADPGLIEVMLHTAEVDQVLIRRGDDQADWIGFGDYSKAEELTNVVRLKQVLQEINERYTLILVDGPTILKSANAEAIASICYGTLIIVDSIDTPVKPLKRALKIIENASPEVVGAVLNQAPLFKRSGYFSRLAKALAHHNSDKSDSTKGQS
jgi:uncharacterized protein involved in exopolysaccharide biosynthesis/Mrp family chromosome partitioning ATPase